MHITVDFEETSYKLEDGRLVCTHESVIAEDQGDSYYVYCANEDCGKDVEPTNILDYLDFKEYHEW